MNVYFRLTNSGSGANVIVHQISAALHDSNIHHETELLPQALDMVPFITPLYKNRETSFDIVHGDVFTTFFKPSKPCLLTFHHVVHAKTVRYKTVTQRLYHLLLFYYEKRALNNADIVVCPSHFTKRELERVFNYKSARVIYNGIDIDVFKPIDVSREKYGIPPEKTVLLFTGNLLKRKGADLLPEIMSRLGDDFVLLLTSGMRKGREIKQKNIISLGYVPFAKLPEIYNLCDIFLFPTRLEGFGYSVAEAMACAKPVVTTNCSALPELVSDEQSGFLCEKDNVDEYIARVRQLHQQKDRSRALGMAGRQKIIRDFSMEQMTKQYVAVYRELTAQHLS